MRSSIKIGLAVTLLAAAAYFTQMVVRTTLAVMLWLLVVVQ